MQIKMSEKLRFDKVIGPQVDSMVDLKGQYEEMKQRFEECRNEMMSLKHVNNV